MTKTKPAVLDIDALMSDSIGDAFDQHPDPRKRACLRLYPLAKAEHAEAKAARAAGKPEPTTAYGSTLQQLQEEINAMTTTKNTNGKNAGARVRLDDEALRAKVGALVLEGFVTRNPIVVRLREMELGSNEKRVQLALDDVLAGKVKDYPKEAVQAAVRTALAKKADAKKSTAKKATAPTTKTTGAKKEPAKRTQVGRSAVLAEADPAKRDAMKKAEMKKAEDKKAPAKKAAAKKAPATKKAAGAKNGKEVTPLPKKAAAKKAVAARTTKRTATKR